jgi:TonB family protein
MTGNATLKIAAFISLGIHLLFLSIASTVFQHPKLPRKETPYVKVILHPLASEKKPAVKIVPPVPLRVGNHDWTKRKIDRKGPNEDPLPLHTSVAKASPLEEPKPVPKNNEEEEISDEPANRVTIPGSVLEKRSDLENQGNRASPAGPASSGGNGSVSSPALHYGEFDGGTFSSNSSGGGKGSGNGTGDSSGPAKSSRKGGGGGNGSRPSYAENPKPLYPHEAREKGYEGEVVLRVEVLINGRVGHIAIKESSGYELLDRSALTTVKQWRFIPAKKGEASIPLWVNIPIKFQLQ